MKHTKKLFAIALTLIMALALTVPAFAAVDNTAKTITIANPENGQTYTAYKIFDATMANDNYAYSIDGDSQFFATVVAFINDAAPTATQYTGNGLTLTKTAEASASGSNFKWNVTADNTLSAPAFAAHLNAAILAAAETEATTDDFAAAGTGSATITVTGAGYYFVDSTLGSLCALDTAKDVTIYEKNSKPSIEKKVQEDSSEAWGDEADADFNQVVNFKLTVNTGTENTYMGNTNDEENLGTGVDANYVIVDALPAGMTYQNDIAVQVGTATWDIGTDYTVDTSVENQITITLLADGALAELAQNSNIVITYSATLDNDADVAGEGNTNAVTLTYNNETSEDSVVVYTYGFDLIKHDGDENVLAGAEFKLYASQVVDGETVIDETAEIGVIFDAELNAYRKVVDGETATVITAGNVDIVGLDSDTYFLVETKAPAGYNALTAPVEFEIDGANLMNATVTENVWEDGGVHVENLTGTELPSTGGIGTTIFYVVGALLMAGAGVLLVTKKRMADEE